MLCHSNCIICDSAKYTTDFDFNFDKVTTAQHYIHSACVVVTDGCLYSLIYKRQPALHAVHSSCIAQIIQ